MSRAISFVSFVWVAYLLNSISPVDFRVFGVVPRDPWGLAGIVMMPFLHGSFTHIFNNSISLLVILSVLYGCICNPDRVSLAVIRIILISGLLLWIFGRGTSLDGIQLCHIGASGLVYGLVTFSFFCSVWTKNLALFLTSLFVLTYTGLSMIDGLIPHSDHVSWDGHLFGAIAGVIVANMDHKEIIRCKPEERSLEF